MWDGLCGHLVSPEWDLTDSSGRCGWPAAAHRRTRQEKAVRGLGGSKVDCNLTLQCSPSPRPPSVPVLRVQIFSGLFIPETEPLVSWRGRGGAGEVGDLLFPLGDFSPLCFAHSHLLPTCREHSTARCQAPQHLATCQYSCRLSGQLPPLLNHYFPCILQKLTFLVHHFLPLLFIPLPPC